MLRYLDNSEPILAPMEKIAERLTHIDEFGFIGLSIFVYSDALVAVDRSLGN